MSELAERLRRLRAQAGTGPGPSAKSGPLPALRAPADPVPAGEGAARAPAAVVSSGSAAVEGLKTLLRRHARARSAPETAEVRTSPWDSRGEADGRSRAAVSAIGESPVVAAEPPLGHELVPGLFEHTECLPLVPPASWQWLPDLHPRLLPTDALLHFDTETTGLAGGTGTRAFMLGFARWSDAGLELRQLWISRLGAEAAMLERFAQWLSEAAFQLVSYNGRSFDAPLLRARYRLSRMRDPLQGLPHHDLLPAVRRRFKRSWPSCRLAEAEARLLGVQRDDDLPGSEAPAAFLSSLRTGAQAPLQRVRLHHRQDLISLARLLPRLCECSARAPDDWHLDPA